MTENLIFGFHAVQAVLQQNPQKITQLYVLKGRHDQRLQQIIALAEQHSIVPRILARQEMDELADNDRHQGIIARCLVTQEFKEADIENIIDNLNEPAFILILDGVQDPHNLGACLRSANAAGVHMVLAPRDKSVGMTPTVRKVASGAAEVTPFIQVTNLARTLELLKDRGIWLYGAAGEASTTLYQNDYRGAVGIVLGAEGTGLRRLTRESCDNLISIPMRGSVESLNVSVATGICLFEVVRQRI